MVTEYATTNIHAYAYATYAFQVILKQQFYSEWSAACKFYDSFRK